MAKGKNRKKYVCPAGKHQNRHRGKVLEVGMQGFLCTFNNKIKDAIREAYNLLNEYAEKNGFVEKEEVAEGNIEDELEQELKGMRQKHNDKKHLFHSIDTGAGNTIFIKIEPSMNNVLDPVKVAHDIVSEIYTTQKAKSRFLLRIVPVVVVCKAYMEDIRKAADQLFDEPFKCDPLTFNVFYNSRNNSSVLRDEVLSAIVTLVRDRNPDHKVDLTSPRKTVIVDVIKGVCCLSVVSDFYKHRKYNLLEAAKGERLKANDDPKNAEVHSENPDSESKRSIDETSEPEPKRAKIESHEDNDTATTDNGSNQPP